MKKATRWLFVAALGIGLLGVLSARAMADEAKEEGKGEEGKKIALTDAPKAVQETIKKEAGKNELMEVEQETEAGKTVYTAKWVVEGNETEITVAEDGKLLKKETAKAGEEDEEKEGGADNEGGE